MSFHNVLFPEGFSYGTQGGPGFSTFLLSTDSGSEQRVARWSQARHTYNVAEAVKSRSDWYDLKAFYMARQGALHSFKFWDPWDYTSASNGRDTPTYLDQELEVIADTDNKVFKLSKVYASGPATYRRPIYKPRESSVVVAVDGVEAASGWTVNADNGRITFTLSQTGVVTAGFRFDVAVRFGKEADAILACTYEEFDNLTGADIPLVEIRDPDTPNGDVFFGGTDEKAIAASYSLAASSARVQVLEATEAGLSVLLPDTDDVPPGGPIFTIMNAGATNSFALKDSTGATTIVTLATGEAVDVFLGIASDDSRSWYVK